jgi:peptidoglycan/LPS O-acetylase OafA/YrhL
MYSHHFVMLGRPEPGVSQWNTYGFIAVAVFFSISGYLMVGAVDRSENFLQFMRRRARRLLPAMVVCAFLMTYVLGACYTKEPLLEYLTSKWALKNWAQWSVFHAQAMPGVFASFIFPNAINGSVWTLPIEISCYVIIGAAIMVWQRPLQVVATLFTGAVLGTMWITHTGTGFSFYGIPLNFFFMFNVCFMGGALMALTEATWQPMRWHLVGVALLSIWLLRGTAEMNVFGMMGATMLVIVIATLLKDRLIAGRFDISYGIYIYAFPIQQLVVNQLTQRFWPSLLLSVALTCVAGWLSYRFVERPFLRPASRRENAMADAVS